MAIGTRTKRRPRTDLAAPLPLGHFKAIEQGLHLRRDLGLSYGSVAMIMAEYHGFHRGRSWWAKALHEHGVPKRPHGNGALNLGREVRAR